MRRGGGDGGCFILYKIFGYICKLLFICLFIDICEFLCVCVCVVEKKKEAEKDVEQKMSYDGEEEQGNFW